MNTPLELPICYYDGTMIGLVYRPAMARARLLLEQTPFEPMSVAGRAAALLMAIDYRETTIGRYREVALGIQVQRRGTAPSLLGLARDPREQPDQGLYMVNLPVTSRRALDAGRHLWGYPKYQSRIDTDFRHDRLNVHLHREVRLTMGASGPLQTPGFPLVTCSLSRGRVLRTVMETDHDVRWGGAGSVKLSLLGDGPTARSIATLGLDAMRPTAAFRTDTLRGMLPAGVDQGHTVMRERLAG